jgi:hypothetical protein
MKWKKNVGTIHFFGPKFRSCMFVAWSTCQLLARVMVKTVRTVHYLGICRFKTWSGHRLCYESLRPYCFCPSRKVPVGLLDGRNEIRRETLIFTSFPVSYSLIIPTFVLTAYKPKFNLVYWKTPLYKMQIKDKRNEIFFSLTQLKMKPTLTSKRTYKCTGIQDAKLGPILHLWPNWLLSGVLKTVVRVCLFRLDLFYVLHSAFECTNMKINW